MCTWEEASLQCFSTQKWMFFSLLINKGTIKHLYVLCLESKVESLASHENLCSSLRVLFQSSRCLQRPSQPNRKYKKKADRKVYSVPQFLGDAEYQSLKAAFIAAWDCSLGMISVYQWLFPWFFIYSIFLSKQNKPSFHFTPVQFLWKEGRPFAVVFFLQRSLWQVQWDFVERSMIMAGTGGISIALLHLNNECVGGETSPSLWASEGENLLELHSCGNLGNTSDTLVLNTPWGPRKAAVILQFLRGFYLFSSDQDTHCPIQALIIFMMPLRIWLDTDLVPGWNGAGLWSHQFFVWWVLS